MAKDFSTMEDSNRSGNREHPRGVRSGAAACGCRLPLGAAASALFGALAGRLRQRHAAPASGPRIGFEGIPIGTTDALTVPKGYVAAGHRRLGRAHRRAGNMPAWRHDASNSAADQEVQMGMHHDGIHYYPLDGSRRGLLVMNHEYTDDGLLHPTA
jgi:secreted PhoX family phosphatase